MKIVLLLLLGGALSANGLRAESEEVKKAKKELAAAYVKEILAPLPPGRPRTEGGPSYHHQKRGLLALGEEGWEAAFSVFRKQRVHFAFSGVLQEGEHPEAEIRLAAMLRDVTCGHREMAVRVLRARQPDDLNEILRPALLAKEQAVREAGFTALNPWKATDEDIELSLAGLGDSAEQVAFAAGGFLRRATGHVALLDGTPSNDQAVWQRWWKGNRKEDRQELRKRELRRCAELVGHDNEEVRKRAGSVLVHYSGQTYFGFHNATRSWWGLADPARSSTSWKKWHSLAWGETFSRRRQTPWEHACQAVNPDVPLGALRATIAMNVGDLDSPVSSVRSLARSSIIRIIGEESPFQEGPSGRVNETLNPGMKAWWAAHVKRLKN